MGSTGCGWLGLAGSWQWGWGAGRLAHAGVSQSRAAAARTITDRYEPLSLWVKIRARSAGVDGECQDQRDRNNLLFKELGYYFVPFFLGGGECRKTLNLKQ